MPALSGNTGNISGNGIVGTLNTWSCTISRAVADVTGFNNSGRNRLLGVYDLTGSAGGVLDSTSSFVSSNFLAAHTNASGAAITMTADSDVAANTIQATCVVSDVTMSVTKTGDSTVTFDFSLASTTTGTNSPFVISWS